MFRENAWQGTSPVQLNGGENTRRKGSAGNEIQNSPAQIFDFFTLATECCGPLAFSTIILLLQIVKMEKSKVYTIRLQYVGI